MKKLLLGGLAFIAFALGSPALAADLPADPLYKSSPLIVPVYDWTGFYVGVDGGWSFGKSSTDFTVTGFAPESISPHMNNWVVGGEAGYNWQFSRNFVAGIEADLQATGEEGTGIAPTLITPGCIPGILCTTTNVGIDQRLRWFGTARARLGFLPFDHLLLYATGGAAFGEIESTTSVTTNTSSILPFLASSNVATETATTTRAGWTAGGGAEWVLSGGWTAKLEYLYVDLGNVGYTLVNTVTATTVGTSSHFTDNIVRVGINYRFGGPVVASY